MEVILDGKRINYEVTGEGKPVILLHGWLASLETMKPLEINLSKNFKVYNVDILGFGKSELPNEPLNTNGFGNFLNNFIKELKIEKPILIGHSNGGKTIINYAGRNLGEINKIILFDSTGIKPRRSLGYYFKIYKFKVLKNILKLLPKKYDKIREKKLNKYGSSDYKASPEILRKTMNKILNEGQEKIMPNIKVPTLLIWGDKDTATPIEMAKKMEKLIPNCGLVTVEGAGHFSYLDNLYLCNTVINEFLKNDMEG